jgi:phage FluMu protein Com
MKQINQTLTNKSVAERLIEKAINQAHQENPRCKEINWSKSLDRDEARINYFLNCVHVSLIKVKHKLL